jgi:hypothetical protein
MIGLKSSHRLARVFILVALAGVAIQAQSGAISHARQTGGALGTEGAFGSGATVENVGAASSGFATTTTLLASAATIGGSGTATLTATVTATRLGGTVAPTSQVSFYIGSTSGTLLGNGPITARCTGSGTTASCSGVATLSVTAANLAAGKNSVIAWFGGDSASDSPSASPAVSITDSNRKQTILPGTLPTEAVYGNSGPYTLTGSGGASGNPVTFSLLSGPGSIKGSKLTITAAGTVVVAANQAGNATYAAAAQVTKSIAIGKALLNVVPNHASRYIGEPNPTFTASYIGLVNGDTAAKALTGAPSFTTSASASTLPGNYKIDAALGTLAAVSYTFKFGTGTLTITSLGATSAPEIAPGVGTYDSPQSVSITDTTPGAVIYYTTNKTTPTTASTKYGGAFTVSASTIVQAIAIAPEYTQSTLASSRMTIQPLVSAPDVTTFHYDNARDGLNALESTLTLDNVNSTQFGKIGFYPVDGLVDAEPLYLNNLNAGGKVRNVLYVATEHASVYAFDADTGVQIWKTSIIGAGETTSDPRNCGQIAPEIGITSTPVINRNHGPHGTLFTVGMTRDAGGNYHQRLHALDIVTGAEIAGSPTEITATYPGNGDNSTNGNVVFDPRKYKERTALLLANGTIYTGWSSHCDDRPYTGWVIGYSESTLKQTQVLNLTPNGNAGAVWMAGNGISADSAGNLYLLDANGTFDISLDSNGFPDQGDFGNAMVKLTTTNSKLAVADYFETYNTVLESDNDTDLGSGGAVLLPDQTDAQGVVHQLIVGAGKDGNIYLADRNNLGKFSATGPLDSNVYQEIPRAITGAWSTPAFFNGVLYYGGVADALKSFPMTNARLASSYSAKTAVNYPYPGTTPSVSADGLHSGIVWALESGSGAPAVLHAYDATNLKTELYNSNQAANGRDSFGNGNKFITPLVVNGKVYVGTPNGVAVFGLLAP